MKKILLGTLIATIAIPFAHAGGGDKTAQAAQKLAHFIKMEQKHKAMWFDYTVGYHDAKFKLIKKHHNELKELARRKIVELGKTGDVDAYLTSKLADLIALHKNHLEEWKSFSKTWADKAKSSSETERAELTQFESSL